MEFLFYLTDFYQMDPILIIHMQKFQQAHWLRACQLIANSAESWNWVQKDEIECRKLKLSWLTGKPRKRAKQNGGRCRRVWREQILQFNAKLDRFNENYQCINWYTSNWTFVQHKRGSTKLLKATNRGFSFATARKDGRLQVWIEVAHFSWFPCNWMGIKAHNRIQ